MRRHGGDRGPGASPSDERSGSGAIPRVLALPTLTHIHMSVIPALVGEGTVFIDRRAHKTVFDGCAIAASHGAKMVKFRHDDPEHLEELLREAHAGPAIVCMDGVNSMTG